MKKIGIIGSSGFVGKALVISSKELDIPIISITKENFKKYALETFDILIHAAMPSGKYWAKNNPFEDYIFLKELQNKKYTILISSFVSYFVRTMPYECSLYPKILIKE